MRDHLRQALLETRQHLLKIKAGKYSEEETEDVKPRAPIKADSGSSDTGPSVEPESSAEREPPMEELDQKEKVEFFRRKRPKAREAIVGRK